MREIRDGPEEGERRPEDSLEEFREQILEEYGPEGLGEKASEGQSETWTTEERERPKAEVETDGKDDKEDTTDGAPRGTPESGMHSSGDATSDTSDSPAVTWSWKDATSEPAVTHNFEATAVPDADQTSEEEWMGTASERQEMPAAISTRDDGVESPEMGSYSRNENQIVMVEHEQGTEAPVSSSPDSELETRGLHRFPAENHVLAETEPEEARTL